MSAYILRLHYQMQKIPMFYFFGNQLILIFFVQRRSGYGGKDGNSYMNKLVLYYPIIQVIKIFFSG